MRRPGFGAAFVASLLSLQLLTTAFLAAATPWPLAHRGRAHASALGHSAASPLVAARHFGRRPRSVHKSADLCRSARPTDPPALRRFAAAEPHLLPPHASSLERPPAA